MSGFEEPVSRRGLLAGSAVAASAMALASCAQADTDTSDTAGQQDAERAGDAGSTGPSAAEDTMGGDIVAFDGKHQAGIQTPVQAHVELVGFNLRKNVGARGATALMRLWTEDARRLCTGENPLGSLEPELAVTPANLTVTCGWGERFFDAVDVAKPSWLRDVRAFEHDDLRPEWGQTDIVLQICSDDPLTAAYVLRHMTRAGKDYANVAWVQQGFSHAYGSAPKGTTARNLFGQKDGTVNPRTDDDFAEQVWIDEGTFAGGSAMVVRRIHMNLDTWEQLDRAGRETATGRTLDTGAPLGAQEEFDPVDLDARNEFGLKAIDENSHVARAHPPADHPEQKILRRPFNYNLPPTPETTARGELSNAGQIFICYQKDPSKQFEPIQARLDEADRLNEWITHIGSAMYYVPAGTEGETFWGESLIRS
ncbi:Dyp-type peroxidase [Corynebacterium minutissimum]|uniref:Dyp-type peroxidase n=1 Tax=Corynebacterium minutissimum TaxID=38301 RepID=A0A2X4RU10_9CORY|nr:Dyp-type peroxidase [Corynebacterium minutissimum]KHO28518.1 peroxidase [Corynebacterium minutissimum]QPS59057.1 Dyp-type peroxidase [Corynebacterium minutissimum]QQA80153.1 Dyp-type peroxidase [Corynebacterium minutissimum]SQH99780.1 iron-dependent peroxidase [Corynebacterium minutissimum]VEG06153.1 iron-dependent peroxidase [Corynebacterium minutissimum]